MRSGSRTIAATFRAGKGDSEVRLLTAEPVEPARGLAADRLDDRGEEGGGVGLAQADDSVDLASLRLAGRYTHLSSPLGRVVVFPALEEKQRVCQVVGM
jgi:hypothetical protein